MNQASRQSKAAVARAMEALTEALGPAEEFFLDRATPMIKALVELLAPYKPTAGELIVMALYLLAEATRNAQEEGL